MARRMAGHAMVGYLSERLLHMIPTATYSAPFATRPAMNAFNQHLGHLDP